MWVWSETKWKGRQKASQISSLAQGNAHKAQKLPVSRQTRSQADDTTTLVLCPGLSSSRPRRKGHGWK